MGDPLITVLVAEFGDRVIGNVVVRKSDRDADLFFRARSHAYVDQICVASDCRKKGAARALLDEAAHRAKREGMSRLELDVWSDNREAKSAFYALGFTTYNEKMYIEI